MTNLNFNFRRAGGRKIPNKVLFFGSVALGLVAVLGGSAWWLYYTHQEDVVTTETPITQKIAQERQIEFARLAEWHNAAFRWDYGGDTHELPNEKSEIMAISGQLAEDPGYLMQLLIMRGNKLRQQASEETSRNGQCNDPTDTEATCLLKEESLIRTDIIAGNRAGIPYAMVPLSCDDLEALGFNNPQQQQKLQVRIQDLKNRRARIVNSPELKQALTEWIADLEAQIELITGSTASCYKLDFALVEGIGLMMQASVSVAMNPVTRRIETENLRPPEDERLEYLKQIAKWSGLQDGPLTEEAIRQIVSNMDDDHTLDRPLLD